MENSQFTQVLNILTYLYNRQYLVKGSELSEHFKLSSRSIRRIISELRSIGYNIESISGPNGGYKLNKSNVILPVRLSEVERNHWQTIENTILSSDINQKDEVLNTLKIISIQSQLSTNYVPEVYVTKQLNANLKSKMEKFHQTLTDAMQNKQRVQIIYNNGPKREFRPQQFQIFNSVAYIKGYYDSSSDSFRTLRLSRFNDIQLINKKYSFNENFEIDNDNSAFSKNIYAQYNVVLKIYPGMHDILDYVYGDNQSITKYPDYSLLKFSMSGDQMIKQLVYSFGVNCEIIEPLIVRDAIKQELNEISGRY